MTEPIDWTVTGQNRRIKAAVIIFSLYLAIVLLHLVSWGYLVVWIVTGILCGRALQLVLAKPIAPPPLTELTTYPFVSIAVAGKNEQVTIGESIEQLCKLDYPRDRYEVWAIDDNSSDRTGEILDELAKIYPHLRVIHRGTDAAGGKSGALNLALDRMQGEIIGVFDADARVSPDTIRAIVPYFDRSPTLGALQLRKAISNHEFNFLTQGQRAEMALDACFQQQRIALGGIGELRGNGQFVRRTALDGCDGWNEETITDDLDLTIRLHLTGWGIELMSHPPVFEEGVTTIYSLWNQRKRWAEGGFQRYLDYWQEIFSDRLDGAKTFDLVSFVLIQYLLPPAAIPDLVIAIWLRHAPILTPMTATLGLALPLWAIWVGLRRTEDRSAVSLSTGELIRQTAIGAIFILHWLVVMPIIILKMTIFSKQLTWVKTPRQGENPTSKNQSAIS
jgi:1,2-diacylglycerol 3-beta-glucosyltransferase